MGDARAQVRLEHEAPANRRGVKGAMASGTRPVASSSATASAVTGVSRMPLR